MSHPTHKHPLHLKPICSISTISHIEHERSTFWYIAAFCCVVGLIVFSIATHTWSFLLAISVGTIVYAYVHKTPSQTNTMYIFTEGIEILHEFYPWKICRSFSIIQHDAHIDLHIHIVRLLKHDIKVHIKASDITEVSEVLNSYIFYDKNKSEHFIDKLAKILKI